MSISRCSSSWIRYSNASLTFIFRFLVRSPKMLGNMSLMLTSISSTPWLEMISNEGKFLSRTSISTMRSSSLPSRNCCRSFSRVRDCESPGEVVPSSANPAGEVSVRGAATGGSRMSSRRSSALSSALSVTFQFLFPYHLDRDFHQIADHRLHVASHISHFSELRSFHLQKRRIRQLRQPARDFRLPHAGRADHDDVLGDHFFGQLRRQFLPPHAIAQSDRHCALRVFLSHHMLVQLRDDLAWRELVQRNLLFVDSSR